MHDTRTPTTRLRLLLLLAQTLLIASIATPAWSAPLASFAACPASFTSPRPSPTSKSVLPRPRAGRRPSTDLGEAPGRAGREGAPPYATGRTAPDYMVEGASTYRVVTDQLGSVRAVLNAAGAVVLSISYDPYGKELAVTGTRSLLPFGFAGGLYDSATGLLRFGARDYDPDLGAWTTKDPSRFAGGLNLYGYANSDPVNFIDPTGFAPSAIDAWLFDIEESGGLDAVAGFGAGLLDNIPLWPGVPTSPTLGGIAAGLGLAAGRPASPCPGAAMSMADKGRSAGNLAGMLVLASAGSAAGSVPQALGRGSTANLSKSTMLARSLREQLAIEQAMSNPAAGAKLPLKMTDPRWPASEGWVKMQQVIQPGGEPINVHYLLNQATGAIDDFKIVLPGPR